MNKGILSAFIVVLFSFFFLSASAVRADECTKGQLSLEMMTETFVPQDTHMAYISGVVDTPNPLYTYDLTFKESTRGMLRGTLSLYQVSFDAVAPQVITPLEIKESFELSPYVDGLFIDVVKKFNWGGEYMEYFKVKFADVNFKEASTDRGTTLICLEPEMYK